MNTRAPTIMMVEDDTQDLELTLMALEEWVLLNRVIVVRSGDEAMDYFYRRGSFQARPPGNPSFVLLDLRMPKISGLEVLKAIKGNDHLQSIPVIVLTASRAPEDLEECYRSGANSYVVKPMDFGEFLWSVRQIAVFWTAVNEPPQARGELTWPVSKDAQDLSGKEESTYEILA